jgi:hypothetical protein
MGVKNEASLLFLTEPSEQPAKTIAKIAAKSLMLLIMRNPPERSKLTLGTDLVNLTPLIKSVAG